MAGACAHATARCARNCVTNIRDIISIQEQRGAKWQARRDVPTAVQLSRSVQCNATGALPRMSSSQSGRRSNAHVEAVVAIPAAECIWRVASRRYQRKFSTAHGNSRARNAPHVVAVTAHVHQVSAHLQSVLLQITLVYPEPHIVARLDSAGCFDAGKSMSCPAPRSIRFYVFRSGAPSMQPYGSDLA